MTAPIIYLKLGGSLITDKRRTESPRTEVLARLATEIASARNRRPHLRLVLAHGSGSFGHVAATRHDTRAGVASPEEWMGFVTTADAAARLNRLVTTELLAAGVPVWSLQPSVALRCRDGVVSSGPADAVRRALDAGLVPLLYGDVALDSVRGGTIVSTEELFAWLARALPPRRIVLAGEVEGVYTADPHQAGGARLLPLITNKNETHTELSLGSSFGTDVTGGMAAKVKQAFLMIESTPGLTVTICSGLQEKTLYRALIDDADPPGTLLREA